MAAGGATGAMLIAPCSDPEGEAGLGGITLSFSEQSRLVGIGDEAVEPLRFRNQYP